MRGQATKMILMIIFLISCTSLEKARGNDIPSNLYIICEYMFIYVMHILYILSLIDILIGHFVEIKICSIIIQRVYSCRVAEERTEHCENLKPRMNFNLFQKEDIPETSIENFMDLDLLFVAETYLVYAGKKDIVTLMRSLISLYVEKGMI